MVAADKIRLLNGVGDWHTYDANGTIPAIMMTDGPHGIRKIEDEQVGDITGSKPATCFPTASAVAASWNREVVAKMAKRIAMEARQEGISIVLGPGINIKRHPLCGRNFEYFSEDPYLAGELGTSYVKSMQNAGIGTSLKHFAANSQETRRMTSNSQVDERALREIYLSAFEKVVKEAKPATIMASYNKLNGEYACANKKLLTDILRSEWGYDGSVISDWGACIDALKCFKAGLNLEMPDNRGYHFNILKEAYEKGELTLEELDTLVENIIKLTEKYPKPAEAFAVNYDEANASAREIEEECAVLLKNKGILPVKEGSRITVIGELAEKMRFQGGGSSHIVAARHKNAIESLKEAGYEVTYLKGYENVTDKSDSKLVEEALSYVSKHKEDIVLFFIGLTDSFEGEGYDRTTLDVPLNQVDLLERISGVIGREKVAAISFGGAPMDFSFDENVSALLHMYLGGQAVGEAVANLVSGRVNPSGKLAETMPNMIIDTPAFRYFAPRHDDVEYRESIFVGYRYYETYDVPIRYPFGYGLSYTTFEYEKLEVPEVYEGKDIVVKVTVKNTGFVPGKEVVELYVIPEHSDIMRSRIELKGFEKIYLEPGEEKTVSIVLNDRAFSLYDTEDDRFKVISGVYTIAAGASVKDLKLKQNIVVQGENYLRNDRKLFPEYFNEHRYGMDISRNTFEKLYGKPLSDYEHQKRGDYTIASSYSDVTKASFFGLIVRGIVNLGIRIMFKGKKKNDPEMKMVRYGIEEGALEGLIATSGGIASPKLVEMLVLNANRSFGKAFLRLFHK